LIDRQPELLPPLQVGRLEADCPAWPPVDRALP